MKYVAAILAFLIAAMALSYFAVYNYWYSALWFRSVEAIRIGDVIGAAILLPVRTLFWLAGGLVDQSTPLVAPFQYAVMNAALLGLLGYACCRRWIFGREDGGPDKK